MAIQDKDLNPETRRKLGLPSRRSRFTKDQVRSHALRAMALLAELSPADRRRVLEFALKLNKL